MLAELVLTAGPPRMNALLTPLNLRSAGQGKGRPAMHIFIIPIAILLIVVFAAIYLIRRS
jgi:hypothetical protein